MRAHIVIVFLCLMVFTSLGQQTSVRNPLTSNLWLNSYTQVRLTEKLYWRAETHFRTASTNNVPFVGRMAQQYNRHALNYIFSPTFNASVGGVLRLNFNPFPGDAQYEALVFEPRIWHEYFFVVPFNRFQLYHRIRIEHRWSRSNLENSDFFFRNRWRYKIYAKVPLNNKKLVPGTFYVNPDIELILQSGKVVGSSLLDDLRLYGYLGYIYSPSYTFTGGLMYTTGQTLIDGLVFNRRLIISFSAYISLDFRKTENKIPQFKLSD